jgi:hypothetical protein
MTSGTVEKKEVIVSLNILQESEFRIDLSRFIPNNNQKKDGIHEKSTKNSFDLITMMTIFSEDLPFPSAPKPATPSTPFDVYTMKYFTRTMPGVGLLQTSPGMHVILAGTGQPWFDPIRNPQCIGIIAGGKFLLFDVGDGATKTLDKLNLPINMIDAVFITHYHSDHINGLGHLISHTWVNGRQQPINVYGPEGCPGSDKGLC